MVLLLQQVTQLKSIQSQWLRAEPWRRWCHTVYARLSEGHIFGGDGQTAPQAPSEEDMGESPAFEVLRYREKDGYCRFGFSG